MDRGRCRRHGGRAGSRRGRGRPDRPSRDDWISLYEIESSLDGDLATSACADGVAPAAGCRRAGWSKRDRAADPCERASDRGQRRRRPPPKPRGRSRRRGGHAGRWRRLMPRRGRPAPRRPGDRWHRGPRCGRRSARGGAGAQRDAAPTRSRARGHPGSGDDRPPRALQLPLRPAVLTDRVARSRMAARGEEAGRRRAAPRRGTRRCHPGTARTARIAVVQAEDLGVARGASHAGAPQAARSGPPAAPIRGSANASRTAAPRTRVNPYIMVDQRHDVALGSQVQRTGARRPTHPAAPARPSAHPRRPPPQRRDRRHRFGARHHPPRQRKPSTAMYGDAWPRGGGRRPAGGDVGEASAGALGAEWEVGEEGLDGVGGGEGPGGKRRGRAEGGAGRRVVGRDDRLAAGQHRAPRPGASRGPAARARRSPRRRRGRAPCRRARRRGRGTAARDPGARR